MRARLVAALASAALGLGLASVAGGADLRRIESVGVVPIEEEASGRETRRDRAVAAAVARAVEQVAEAALTDDAVRSDLEAAGGGKDPGDIAPVLAPALGSDPFEYATRFRILEDRGVRPSLLSDAPTEYVVLVEVFLDDGRIRERLARAGWTDPAGPQDTNRVRIVIEGLRSFAAYDALRRALLEELDVRSALPVELARGRAVLEVESDYDPDALLAALQDSADRGLRVVPVRRESQILTVLVDWTPPPADGPAPVPGAGSR